MNRRGFFGSLLTTAAVLYAKPSIVLEIFRERSIAGPINHFITTKQLTEEALRILKNNLVLARNFNYDGPFMPGFGDTVKVRYPQQFTISDKT